MPFLESLKVLFLSADESADESAGTFPEMSVNIYFFDHLGTA